MLKEYFERENFESNYICELSNMEIAIRSACSGLAMAFCHGSLLHSRPGSYPHIYCLQPPLRYYHCFCYLSGKQVSEQVHFMLEILMGKGP